MEVKVIKHKDRPENKPQEVPGVPDWDSMLRTAQDQVRSCKTVADTAQTALRKAEANERAIKSMREIALKI